MRRPALAAVTFFVGLAVGLAAGRSAAPPREPRAAPPVVLAETISLHRTAPPHVEMIVLRPYAVTADGRTEFVGEPAPDEARWVVSFGEGRVHVACEQVARR